MKKIHSAVARGARSLGWPGILGLALLVLAGAFHISTLRAEQSRLYDMQQKIVTARAQRAALSHAAGAPATPEERLVAFYGFFPRANDWPELLEKIFSAAKAQGLRLEHGEYQVSRGNAGELTQFQLTLPLRGTYPQIRKFVDAAFAEVPALSLDGIQFDRQKVGDSTVLANVKLTLYLGKKS